MKILFLAIVLFAGSAWAAEYETTGYDCAAWTEMDEMARSTFLMGWHVGAKTADALAKGNIMPLLWPTGHRLGSVKIEIDVRCEKPENRSTHLGDIIMLIALQKNR
jgi:hypothetical protein